jgi:hypothetical protein
VTNPEYDDYKLTVTRIFYEVNTWFRINLLKLNVNKTHILHVRFEVFTAVTMKNAVFWDVAPCRSCRLNRRFGGTYRLHLQGRKICERRTSVSRWLQTSYQSKTPSYIWAGGEGDGGDMFLWNVGSIHKIYTVPHPRRRHSPYSSVYNNEPWWLWYA